MGANPDGLCGLRFTVYPYGVFTFLCCWRMRACAVHLSHERVQSYSIPLYRYNNLVYRTTHLGISIRADWRMIVPWSPNGSAVGNRYPRVGQE